MKSLIFLIVVMAICVFGIMLVGVVVYIAGEAFGYLAWGVPVSFDKVQIMRLFRMCRWGGGVLGLGIGVMSLLKVKRF